MAAEFLKAGSGAGDGQSPKSGGHPVFDDAFLRDLIERGASLAERLGPAFQPLPPGEVEAGSLAEWRLLVGDADPGRFRARLSALGLSEDTAWKAVARVTLHRPPHLPTWAALLSDLVDELRRDPAADDSTEIELATDTAPGPVLVWLRPIIGWACRLLDRRLESSGLDSGPGVRAGLATWLARRLGRIAGPSIMVRYDAWAGKPQASDRTIISEENPQPRSDGRFETWLQSRGRLQILADFPGLARLTAIVVGQWADASVEFLLRLGRDRAELIAALLDYRDPGPLAEVIAGLSDSHHRGRSVMIGRFTDGRAIVYKPRDLGLERWWVTVSSRFEKAIPESRFGAARVLARPGYGWMEAAPERPAGSPEIQLRKEAARHSGRLAALLTSLGATGFSRANVIDGADGPQLIDMETLFPCPPTRMGKVVQQPIFHDSVLSTGFPPMWQEGGSGVFPSGGMDSLRDDPGEFPEELRAGWDEMAAALRSDPSITTRSTMTDGPEAGRCRIDARDTTFYRNLADLSLEPAAMGSGVARSLVLERLFRVPSPPDLFAKLVKRCTAELDALDRFDTPRFEVRAGATDLLDPENDGNTLLPGCFAHSPLEEAGVCLTRFLQGGEVANRRLFLESCHFRNPMRAPPTGVSDTASRAPISGAVIPVGNRDAFKRRLRQEARSVGNRILEESVPTRRGSLTWMQHAGFSRRPHHPDGPPARGNRGFRRFDPPDPFMVSGQAGIALFLASLASLDDRFREPARRALAWFREFLEDAVPESQLGIGGAEGLGSLVFCIVAAAGQLEDLSWLEEAWIFRDLLTPEAIDLDNSFDLTTGAAGTVLSAFGALAHLPAAFAETSEWAGLAAMAEKAAEHLAKNRILAENGTVGWRTTGTVPISGFGHGVAGIAAALHLASRHFRRTDFKEAVDGAIAFERSLFRQDAGNWLANGSTDTSPSFLYHWCHGATGIGFSRLLMSEREDAWCDIEPAVKAIAEIALPFDHVCCGEAGRLSFLFEAGRRCGRPDWEDLAFSGIERMLLRRDANDGRFNLPDDGGSRLPSTSLFRGLSGIGALFLRCADPDRSPCPWLWK